MFATVIAITKDLPDIEGDKAHNISTFATRLGVQNVSLLGEWAACAAVQPSNPYVQQPPACSDTTHHTSATSISSTWTAASIHTVQLDPCTLHDRCVCCGHLMFSRHGPLAIRCLLPGIGMLLLNYVGAIALAFSNPAAFNMPIMVGAHAVLAAVLLLRAWKLGAAGYTKEAVANFYSWIWNLFYSEYLLLPIL